ncbi:hypothetical protein SAMN05421813_10915 [Daejeonella rubra]|uniref:Uncharacterized protein n=1 Tax=Daejeonella rubra TaxID=990371 RepID=A0A1G9S053_9SPHI|nr:hypothetical protein [Daejeonella rubra]SDM28836.1 hypothetical protein SAMN05421813_10915 [Daejeonella rubra]
MSKKQSKAPPGQSSLIKKRADKPLPPKKEQSGDRAFDDAIDKLLKKKSPKI